MLFFPLHIPNMMCCNASFCLPVPVLPCSVAFRVQQLARLIQFLSMFVSGFMIGFIKGWELALVRGRP